MSAAVAKRKACPECGGKPETFENPETGKFSVFCSECGFEDTQIVGSDWTTAKCVAVEYPTKTAAIKAWNELEGC